MQSLHETTQERKPYDSPAVVYEAVMEVKAGTQGTAVSPGVDLFDVPAGN